MELFNAEMKSIWNKWDLKVLVLLNVAMQLLLLFLGSRRKSTPKISLRVIVWCAYIAADSLASVALGILLSKLGDEINGDQSGAVNEESNLLAFWAPSLLLLLGGPDTITAYSMEDNELWLRHLLGLIVQTTVTAYICMLAWSTASYLSFLSLAMFACAVIKYGERVWVLWQSSKEKRSKSILAPPYAGTNYPTFMEEYALKQQEGYHVAVDEIVELPVPKNIPLTNDNLPEAKFLIKAHHLHQIVSRLFLDLVMTDDDRDMSVNIFREFGNRWRDGFKVVEIELSFMYDLLHTKAMVLYSWWGVGRRLVTFAISSLALIVFSLANKPPKYDGTILGATFLLLGVIVLLDVYSLFAMLTSDWTHVWLSNKETGPKFGLDRVVPHLNWSRQARCSNSVGQLSLLSFCTKRESVPCQSVLKRLHIQEKVETYYHTRHEKLLDTVKRAMFDWVVEFWQSKQDPKRRNDLNCCLSDILRRYIDIDDLEWSPEMELDKCILVWHVATELCYHSYGMDKDEASSRDDADWRLQEGHTSYNLVAKILSHYMCYLLVLYPFMLPRGIGQIRVRDTCAEARKFFQERGLWSLKQKDDLQLHGEACKLLLEVNTEVPPHKVKGERSKSVLFDGCRLATVLIKKLNEKEGLDDDQRTETAWCMIGEIWLEILTIAARKSSGESHSMQLRRGGELLTFEWLLLAHFGLTEHFQMTKGHAIAKLILH